MRIQLLPFLLDQQQPRIGRIDEGTPAFVQPHEIVGDEQRGHGDDDECSNGHQREHADRFLGQQAENGEECRLDREEMAEPMLFQRLVELQQIEIRLPLFEKPGFCGFHITSPPAFALDRGFPVPARARAPGVAPSGEPYRARRARLRISAPVPKVHGAILSAWLTRLTSAPSFGVGDRHDVADLVREALARAVAVLGRREHRAEEQHQAVRDTGGSGRSPGATRSSGSRLISPSSSRRRSAKPSGPSTRSASSRRAHVVDAEALVEQADERADRARRVVVLGLAEQQRAAALEVAQVDVVAERRADASRRGC